MNYTTIGTDVIPAGNSALSTLKAEITGLPGGVPHGLIFGSETLAPGIYDVTGATTHTGVLTFNAGAVTNTVSGASCVGDIGTSAGITTGWVGFDGTIYLSGDTISKLTFVFAVDGTPVEASRVNKTSNSTSGTMGIANRSITSGIAGVISVMTEVFEGTMTTGERNIFSLKLT